MSNKEVIKRFVEGLSGKSFNGNLFISLDGQRLINYNTCIAQRVGYGKYVFNRTKYSTSTSKIQSYVAYYLKTEKYKEVTDVPINSMYLA